jgi:hypothetical protein
VIRRDETNDVSNGTPIQVCVERLLSGCLEEDDGIRVSSARVVEELAPHVNQTSFGTSMLAEAVNSILAFDTEGGPNRRKKLKAELAGIVLLCRRLLDSGCNPDISLADNTFILDSVVEFVNTQLELLGEPPNQACPACPPWKVSKIQELARLLRLKNAKGETQQYDIGNYRYESFFAETKKRRTEILLEVLQPQLAAYEEASKPEVLAALQKDVKFTDLLELLVLSETHGYDILICY